MADSSPSSNRKLFVASFIALVTTAFSFMLRVQLMPVWEEAFELDKTQAGRIFGAGFWPFGISIVIFSLVIDRIGYGKAMVFAFLCHVAFAVMTIFANGYAMLYWASVVGALGNGTVEAVINPLIATIFPRGKTKWLNILHAGWPGGLVITGFVVLGLDDLIGWQVMVGLILVPTAIYGAMLLGSRFPVSERVAAGVSHRQMVAEMGFGGAFVISFLIVSELTGVITELLAFSPSLSQRWIVILAITLAITGATAAYVRSFGRPMFVFLAVVMLLLATTELGTDSWVKDLLGPVVNSAFGIDGGWVLVYTAAIMMVLRFVCGPIVEALKPLGVLATSSAIIAVGIWWLSILGGDVGSGATLLVIAATVYGLGQTFFWPTTLGLVAEQFPRGGAMTLNVMGGVGMIGVGVLGNPWLGNVQDRAVVQALQETSPAIYQEYVTDERETFLFGTYRALDTRQVKAAPPQEKELIESARIEGKMTALRKVIILPILMLLSYLGLMLYFRIAKGGYEPVELHPEPELGPAEV